MLYLPRSTFCYKHKLKDDEGLIAELNTLVEKHVSIGFWKSYHRIRRKGILVNHKRLYRIYTTMKLNIRRRARKRLPARVKQQLFQPATINQVWSIDFMSDSLWDGRKIRLLNVIDDYNRVSTNNRNRYFITNSKSYQSIRANRWLQRLPEDDTG